MLDHGSADTADARCQGPVLGHGSRWAANRDGSGFHAGLIQHRATWRRRTETHAGANEKPPLDQGRLERLDG
jgi:hypothetical protein